jgi:hypothetical protein
MKNQSTIVVKINQKSKPLKKGNPNKTMQQA